MEWPSDPGLANVVRTLTSGVRLPRMKLLHRDLPRVAIADVEAITRRELRRLLADADGHGAPIAVGVGSRGIVHLAALVRAVVDELGRAGFAPFVVPAMGSHGGATARGQEEVLARYGIDETTMGVPVRATMETAVVGEVDGTEVRLDRHVVECGRVFLVCRIKPHTDFRGDIESGPTKMAAIGLGKQAGAQAIHALGVHGLRHLMPQIGRYVASTWLLGALAVVENPLEQTAVVRALRAEEIGGDAERSLLCLARDLMPALPVHDLDVLVIERIGKDISGTGMDPNVTRRWLVPGIDEPDARCRTIVALDLTEQSHGNAIGMGLADFVPESFARKVDLTATYMNTLTSGWAGLRRGRLPIVLPTARDAVLTALAAAGAGGRPRRLVWIRDTLHVDRVAVSEALWDEVAAQDDATLGETFLAFDGSAAAPSLIPFG